MTTANISNLCLPQTFADISKARRLAGYTPTHRIEQGLDHALDWYRHNL